MPELTNLHDGWAYQQDVSAAVAADPPVLEAIKSHMRKSAEHMAAERDGIRLTGEPQEHEVPMWYVPGAEPGELVLVAEPWSLEYGCDMANPDVLVLGLRWPPVVAAQ